MKWLAAALLAALVIAAPSLAPLDPLTQDLARLNAAPGAGHWLGTDHLGRDVLSRLLSGAGTTLVVALGGALAALLLGTGLGVLATLGGRSAEVLAFAAVDVLRGLPPTLLGLIALAALGPGVVGLVLALAASFAPTFAHVARLGWRREMAEDYAAAALAAGAGPWRVAWRHLGPNVVGPLVTLFAIIAPRCVVTESVLSFLGLGAQPDSPTWGRMVADSLRLAEVAPHALLAPVLAIAVVTSLSALGGNWLRRRANARRGG